MRDVLASVMIEVAAGLDMPTRAPGLGVLRQRVIGRVGQR